MTAATVTPQRRMTALAESFPSLVGAPGVRPWSPMTLDDLDFDLGDAAVYAAAFVLEVWSSRQPWRCGPFRLLEAMQAWDEAHRDAFAAWAARPWQP